MMRDLRHQQHARTFIARPCAILCARPHEDPGKHLLHVRHQPRAVRRRHRPRPERHPVAAFVAGRGLAPRARTWFLIGVATMTGRRAEKPSSFVTPTRHGLLGLAVTASAIRGQWIRGHCRRHWLPSWERPCSTPTNPVVHFFGRNPFPRSVRRIHQRVQNESPGGLPAEMAFGFSCALADVVIAVRGRRRRGIAGSVRVGRVLV